MAFVHACMQAGTLLWSGDTLYDPIVLPYQQQLMAAMSSACSWLHGRCTVERIYKARQTPRRLPLPVGFCYDGPHLVVFDPDPRVQVTLRQIFQTFDHTRSLRATVRVLQEQSVAFPGRAHNGPGRADGWRTIQYADVGRTLHNPRYAGAYVYGRTRRTHPLQGKAQIHQLPQNQWVVIWNVHAGYITWDEYEAHCAQLAANSCHSAARSSDHAPSSAVGE